VKHWGGIEEGITYTDTLVPRVELLQGEGILEGRDDLLARIAGLYHVVVVA
jgi:hypothetical protein